MVRVWGGGLVLWFVHAHTISAYIFSYFSVTVALPESWPFPHPIMPMNQEFPHTSKTLKKCQPLFFLSEENWHLTFTLVQNEENCCQNGSMIRDSFQKSAILRNKIKGAPVTRQITSPRQGDISYMYSTLLYSIQVSLMPGKTGKQDQVGPPKKASLGKGSLEHVMQMDSPPPGRSTYVWTIGLALPQS